MSSARSSRRAFLRGTSAALLYTACADSAGLTYGGISQSPLEQFAYGDVALESARHARQLQKTTDVLMGLSDDGLLKPFRVRGELPAPGEDLGGWYTYKPDYDYHKDSAGLCPGGTFGQWISALARTHAITGEAAAREKVLRLNQLYASAITDGFFQKNRFPAYCYDKLVCGLIDAHQFAGDPQALAILARTTDIALRYLPERAIDREVSWRPGTDVSYTWDESYTLPENLFLAYRLGAGSRYLKLAEKYLLDQSYFDPLAANRNVFAGKHAYSYINALNSSMQAYLTLGSQKHLMAAKNAFEMLVTSQSFATGGWGPDEQLRAPGSDDLFQSLTKTHNSFETPCGAYAHFKLTRYLLRVTRDSQYGDSMEQVMYNTVLGAKPLQADGTAFYYSDYNFAGKKGYSRHHWPCCSGTLPQVAADYCINSYFHDGNGLYVNLYVPSRVRWNRRGTTVQLRQRGDYPFSSVVSFEVSVSKPETFPLHLRIPAWTQSPAVSVNGKRLSQDIAPGSFMTIARAWKDGDRIELELPMNPRLTAIDARHSDVMALSYGPMVLFATGERPPALSRKQLLAVQRVDSGTWALQTPQGIIAMKPFLEIDEQPYTTYVKCT